MPDKTVIPSRRNFLRTYARASLEAWYKHCEELEELKINKVPWSARDASSCTSRPVALPDQSLSSIDDGVQWTSEAGFIKTLNTSQSIPYACLPSLVFRKYRHLVNRYRYRGPDVTCMYHGAFVAYTPCLVDETIKRSSITLSQRHPRA